MMDVRHRVHANNSATALWSAGCWGIGEEQDKVFALMSGVEMLKILVFPSGTGVFPVPLHKNS